MPTTVMRQRAVLTGPVDTLTFLEVPLIERSIKITLDCDTLQKTQNHSINYWLRMMLGHVGCLCEFCGEQNDFYCLYTHRIFW